MKKRPVDITAKRLEKQYKDELVRRLVGSGMSRKMAERAITSGAVKIDVTRLSEGYIITLVRTAEGLHIRGLSYHLGATIDPTHEKQVRDFAQKVGDVDQITTAATFLCMSEQTASISELSSLAALLYQRWGCPCGVIEAECVTDPYAVADVLIPVEPDASIKASRTRTIEKMIDRLQRRYGSALADDVRNALRRERAEEAPAFDFTAYNKAPLNS